MAILTGDLATTKNAGKLRVATNAEAAAGANVVAAITPAQLQAAVAAGVGSIVGALTYRGLFDPTNGAPDLSTAVQGDFYKVSANGEFPPGSGVFMNVGDNLYINADMNGVIDLAKLDIIDNTESIIFINDLHDVTIDTPVDGQYLKYEGGEWVNSTVAIGDVTGLQTTLDAEATARSSADSLLQGELNLTQTSAGLLASGSLSPFPADNFLSGQSSLRSAIVKLDTELARVDASISEGLQTEIDAIETAVGLQVDGTLIPFAGTNYVDSDTTIAAAIVTLDDTVQVNHQDVTTQLGDAVDTLNTSIGAVDDKADAIIGAVDLLASGDFKPFDNVGVVGNKTTYLSAVNALSAELVRVDGLVVGGVDALQEELDLTQASVGLLASGSLSPFGGSYTTGQLNIVGAISALDTALKAEETARLSNEGTQQTQLDGIENNIDAVETTLGSLTGLVGVVNTSVGLSAAGELPAFTTTGIVNGETSIVGAINALSVEVDRVDDLVVGGVDALQAELDLTQASVGLLASGSLSPFGGSFTTGQTTITGAISALDSALHATDSALTSEVTRLDERVDSTVATFSSHPDHAVYVSDEWGDDTNNGGMYTPVKTIDAAIALLPSDGSFAVVNIFPGSYTGGVSITRTNTHLLGMSAGARSGHSVRISGGVTVNPTVVAGGVYNNAVLISGCLINGGATSAVSVEGATAYSLGIRNCQLHQDASATATLLQDSAATAAHIITLESVQLNSQATDDTANCVDLSVSKLRADLCEVYRNGGGANSFAIAIGGTAVLQRMTNCLVDGDQADNLVYLDAGTHSVGNCSFSNSTAGKNSVYLNAGAILLALYTAFNVPAGGYIVDGAVGSVLVYANNTYVQSVTVSPNVVQQPLAGSIPAGLAQVAYTGLASDVITAASPTNFTAAALTSQSFFDGIDDKLGDIDTAIAAAGKVETVNSIAPVEGSKDVVLTADNIVTPHIAVNYEGLDTDSITTHFEGVDLALGTLFTAVAAAGKVETVNSVGVEVGTKNILLDADDIVAPHTAVNYIAGNTDSITTHLSGLDTALATKATTVNSVGVTEGTTDILIDGDDLVVPYDGVNYAKVATDTLTDHLTGVDSALGGIVADLSNLSDSLSAVATSGNYSDLLNVPTNNVNQIVIDTTATALTLSAGRHYLFNTASGSTKEVYLPSTAAEVSDGDYIRITNFGNGTIRVMETGESSFVMDGTTLEGGAGSVGQFDIVINTTVDLYAFKLPPVRPVAWTVYFNNNVKLDARNAADQGLVYFDEATQSLKVSETALSAVATSGLASDVVTSAAPTNFTAATLTAQAFFDGIDGRLGELALAENIAVGATPTNIAPAEDNVKSYLSALDAKFSTVAISQGNVDQLQVAGADGSLAARAWSAGSDNHLKPDVDNAYDIGDATHKVNEVFATLLRLGSGSLNLEVNGDNNLVFNGNVVKALGAPFIDYVVPTNAVNLTLSKNGFYICNDSGTATWTLPASPLEGNVVFLYFKANPTITVASSAANIQGGVSSVVIKGQGNAAFFAWDAGTTTWVYHEARTVSAFGNTQNFNTITASQAVKVENEYLTANTTAINLTLPALSTVSAGDKVKVVKGWLSTAAVVVLPNAADAGAEIMRSSLRGYSADITVGSRGESTMFVVSSDKTRWEIKEEFYGTVVTQSNITPTLLTASDTLVTVSNAGDTIVKLPPATAARDGSVVRVIAKGGRQLTLSVNDVDSGDAHIFIGNSDKGDSTAFYMTDGTLATCVYDRTNNVWLVMPPLGTASLYDVGTAANNVVQLNGQGKLPAVDGSLLTNIATGSGRLTFSKETTSFTATKMFHHSVDTTGGTVTAALPPLANVDDGDVIRIRLTTRGGTNNVSITSVDTVNGAVLPLLLTSVGESAEFLANKTDNIWELI